MEKALRYILGTLAAVALIGALGFFGFVYSGVYNIAANEPHLRIMRWVFATMQERSIREHAGDVAVPELREPALVREGSLLYTEHCVLCHGAPGVGPGIAGIGMNPNPPPLVTGAAHWTDAEIYWIVKHGIKMAGMPAYAAGLTETQLWALTAFVRRMTGMSQEEYLAMVAAAAGQIPATAVEWVEADDPGFLRMVAQGDAGRGKRLLDAYGCGACHKVSGVRGAEGLAGPPLDHWAERHFIAGALVNTPDNLVRWIVDPQEIEPGTVMPDLDVAPAEALDMAAYLFTLGEPPAALHTVRGTKER